MRDIAGVLGTGLPVWCQGAAAPPSVAGLTFVAWQQPIACGGVAVFPDDIVVVDQDGAVLIPAACSTGRGGRRDQHGAVLVESMSSGNTATPPQAIGCCQETKVRLATDGGAAAPWHHTGRPVPSTPAMSRTTPSVISPETRASSCARRGYRRRCQRRSRRSRGDRDAARRHRFDRGAR